MNYRQIRPCAVVGEYVEFYWILQDESPPTCIQRIVPDGRAAIILNFANPFQSQKNGTWHLQPESFLVGQITGPLLLRPSGAAGMLGIQFRPHGVTRLFQLPIFELTDSAIALEDLPGRLFPQLEKLRDLRSLEQAAAALDSTLHAIAAQVHSGDDPISYAVNAIEHTRGLISIERMAERVGWSTRHLQRRFKSAVGISPKLFSRMQRFQRVFSAMENAALDWVDAAVYCGYYDQAHLIRDFRDFTGTTPTALLGHEIDLSLRFVQNHTMSHFSKTAESTSW